MATHAHNTKFILVTGGVLSGIGKGIVASSTGVLLKSLGLSITAIKIDPYLNVDAGTMSPFEHGEVFVLDDGGEVDLDLGNYERFVDISLTREHNLTTGKIYDLVIRRERRGDYLGKTVQVVPHVTDAIQEWLERVARIPVDETGREPDVCIIELGGTIGDIEHGPFIEAMRQFQFRVGRDNFCSVHVSLVPVLGSVGEQKTKPTQQSVQQLRALGISPDVIVARSSTPLIDETRHKIASFCHCPPNAVIGCHDVSNTYSVPLLLHAQGMHQLLLRRFALLGQHVPRSWLKPRLEQWKLMALRMDRVVTSERVAHGKAPVSPASSSSAAAAAAGAAPAACGLTTAAEIIAASEAYDRTCGVGDNQTDGAALALVPPSPSSSSSSSSASLSTAAAASSPSPAALAALVHFPDNGLSRSLSALAASTGELRTATPLVRITIVGKYTGLADSYLSVLKALQHASLHMEAALEVVWIEAETLEDGHAEHDEAWAKMRAAHGILVPGGFGDRGVEGKVAAAKYARESNTPYLGICLGMQVAVIEFARNVLGLKNANSAEFREGEAANATANISVHGERNVVVLMLEQDPNGGKGGTMRLGKRRTVFTKPLDPEAQSIVVLYGRRRFVDERHRHRYEVDIKTVPDMEAAGLEFVGRDESGERMEIVQLRGHPFFVATQYHPEFMSRPNRPSPPFAGLILAATGRLQDWLAEKH